VGGKNAIKVDVRVIAATNKDLEQAMREGKFREDLYYRLNVVTIFVPPLRERKGDIPVLVEHFLKKYNEENGKNVNSVSKEAMECLLNYHWPGNIRELENCMERAVILAPGETIYKEYLPFNIRQVELVKEKPGEEKPMEEYLSEMEKGLIRSALERSGGVIARAANLLGMNERKLRYRIQKYGLSA